MASRFWVGGAGTWDASDTTHWAATSGTAGGQSVPGSGDTVTFDGSSGGGTVTVSHASLSVTSITAGAFTGTLDFNTNNNNVTAQTVSFSGSGTRTINMGSGTWTITSTATPNCFDVGTVTGLTATFSNASITLSANATIRQTQWGTSLSYGPLTIAANSSKGSVFIGATTGVTFASLTVGSGNTVYFPQGVTTTITGASTITGTSSAPCGTLSSAVATNATVSVGSTLTMDWAGIMGITKAGAGSISATNSLDMGRNTTVTITAPSGGGSSGGQRVISG